MTKTPPVLPAGLLHDHARASSTPTPACPFPAYFPNRAELALTRSGTRRRRRRGRHAGGRGARARRLPARPLAARAPAARSSGCMRYPPMRHAWEHELPQAMARRMGGSHGRGRCPPPSPQHPVQLRRRDGRDVAPARGHPVDRLRPRRPDVSRTASDESRGASTRSFVAGQGASPPARSTGAASPNRGGGLNELDPDGLDASSSSPTRLEEALRGLAEAGFENVEIGAVKGFLEHLDPDALGDDEIADTRRLLDENGLRASR